MVRNCCVKDCKVSSEDEIILFKFPHNRILRRKWLDTLKPVSRSSAIRQTVKAVICNQHFSQQDYVDVKGKLKLKDDVVPSIFNCSLVESMNSKTTATSKTDDNGATSVSTPTCNEDKENVSNDLEEVMNTNGIELDGLLVCEQEMRIEDLDPDGNEVEHVQELCPDSIALNINEDSSNSQKNDLTKHDIEDILTNYFIPTMERKLHEEDEVEKKESPKKESPKRESPDNLDSIVLDDDEIDKPVYIEISVEPNVVPKGSSEDCLMLLENVQVEVDPATLFPGHEDDADIQKEDPISLLTSSDEDDVIIQEPHIDTVEVSDETDEDDVPLVKLVKIRKKKTKKLKEFTKIVWNLYEYRCPFCKFSTTDKGEMQNHRADHTKVIQVCAVCNYTTASTMQFARHKRKHKEDRRFKCHLCDFKARHNMSLIYHLKSHDKANLCSYKNGFKCQKCGFKSDVKSCVLKHVRLCSVGVKMFSCDQCVYETKRRSDLKRHKDRKHQCVDDYYV